jgi:hypothetical protein
VTRGPSAPSVRLGSGRALRAFGLA